jgi:hypothetical protein
MSIDNIPTNYTNLINPIVNRSVIVNTVLPSGSLQNEYSLVCPGLFGQGSVIANIAALDPTVKLAISTKGNDPQQDGVLTTIPPGLPLNIAYTVGYTNQPQTAILYSDSILNPGSPKLFPISIPGSVNNSFYGISLSENSLLITGSYNDGGSTYQGFFYKQPINGGLGSVLSTPMNTTALTFSCNDGINIYAIGSSDLQYPDSIYSQPIEGGSATLLHKVANSNFRAITNDSTKIYTCGANSGQAIIYFQPKDGSAGTLYTDTTEAFYSITNDDNNIYAAGTGVICVQPKDGSLKTVYNITDAIFYSIAIDGINIYAAGSFQTNSCIYKQPINGGAGSFYSVPTLPGLFGSLSLTEDTIYAFGTDIIFVGAGTVIYVYTQYKNGDVGTLKKSPTNNNVSSLSSICPYITGTDYTSPQLTQDSNLVITNLGDTIVRDELNLVVNYLEA